MRWCSGFCRQKHYETFIMKPGMEVKRSLYRRAPPRNRLLSRESAAPAPSRQLLRNGERYGVPLLLLVVGTVLGIYTFPYIKAHINQPVARVLVEGDLKYLERREVMDRVPVFQGDRWLEVDLNQIRQEVETLPWIYSAQVSRQWPHTLHIRLQEQKPIAIWNERQLLNQYGEVFDRSDKVVADLPVLQGVEGSEQNVMERFMEFSRLLAPLHLQPVRLQLDERYAWNVTLNNGTVIKIGNNKALERMQRFVFLYQQELAKSPRPIAVVDLRYGSGAAVRWQPLVKVSG